MRGSWIFPAPPTTGNNVVPRMQRRATLRLIALPSFPTDCCRPLSLEFTVANQYTRE